MNNLQRAVIAADNSSAVEAHVAVFFDQDSNPSATISHSIADAIIKYIQERNLQVEWHIETHVHADHLSAGPYLQNYLGGKLAIGEHIVTVQETFGKIFNEGTDFQRDASQFDHLFKDGETYAIGNLEATAIHTPGHTPACMVHVIGKSAFVGDTMVPRAAKSSTKLQSPNSSTMCI